ncbi:MAG: MFS transporter [Candidatus Dormibacteraeota bacterium]|uniref:MFS transporter n=1 Tax=Candidatus Dormiibacter inghamiae TaxID=3127013 RepID=A0A934N6S9_9BACT|nr:MFS transporter [Candidatus Dormibacteraeota bacterium]MBJ7606677.1 MFS transporter [Candidatus Dormibacteraeota bacterium]
MPTNFWRGTLRRLRQLASGQLGLALAGLATGLVSFDSSILTLALPAIGQEFHAGVPTLATVGALLAAGSLLGLPLAVSADRFGRRRVLVAGVAGFSLANLLSAAAPGLSWLAASRLLAVALETAVAGTAAAYAVEQAPARGRGTALSFLAVAGGAGAGLSVVLYPFLAPNWRLLYALGAAGLLALPLLLRRLPESRAWRRLEAASGGLRVLLEPPWRRRVALFALAAALGEAFFGPANLLLALFGQRELHLGTTVISLVFVAAGLGSLPGFAAGSWLAAKGYRRLPAVGLAFAAALTAGLSFAGRPGLYLAGDLLWTLLAGANVAIAGAWLGELFPTRARATADTTAAVAAAAGSAAGLLLVGLLEPQLGLGRSLLLMMAGGAGGALLLLLLPGTSGGRLPE